MDFIAYIVPPLSVLAGVVVTQLFNRWQRREHFQRMIFDKKLHVYSELCGLSTNLIGGVIRAEPYETIPDHISVASDTVIHFMQANYLLISVEIKGIVGEIRKSIPKHVIKSYPYELACAEMISLNNLLQKVCREELGLDSFEKHIRKSL